MYLSYINRIIINDIQMLYLISSSISFFNNNRQTMIEQQSNNKNIVSYFTYCNVIFAIQINRQLI